MDDGAFLGGGSTFHQFMHIGRLVMVQGSSAFGKDLPPFVIAAERNSVFGVNIVGLRRAGFSAKDREEIKTAFKLVYTSGLNISQALEQGATMKFRPAAREFLDFVANAKKRGICPLKRGPARRVFSLTRHRQSKPNQRKHAASFSFFGAVGVVTIEVTSGAYAGVVNFFHAKRAALPDNFRCEIDFVMRRANTGAELHDDVRGI